MLENPYLKNPYLSSPTTASGLSTGLYFDEQSTRNLIETYKTRPRAYNRAQIDIMKRHASAYNIPFAEEEQSWADYVSGITGQLLSGYISGLTTLQVGGAPQTGYEGVARAVGSIAGFTSFIPSAPFKLLGMPKLATAALAVRGKASVPLMVANKAMQGLTKAAPRIAQLASTSKAASSAIKMLSSPAINHFVQRGTRLGIASAVSSWQGGIDQMLKSFGHGALGGIADGLVGSYIKFKDSPAGEAWLKALAGSLVDGLPSTLQGDTTPEQVYYYLRGAYFGKSETGWQDHMAAKHHAAFVEGKYPSLEEYLSKNDMPKQVLEIFKPLADKHVSNALIQNAVIASFGNMFPPEPPIKVTKKEVPVQIKPTEIAVETPQKPIDSDKPLNPTEYTAPVVDPVKIVSEEVIMGTETRQVLTIRKMSEPWISMKSRLGNRSIVEIADQMQAYQKRVGISDNISTPADTNTDDSGQSVVNEVLSANRLVVGIVNNYLKDTYISNGVISQEAKTNTIAAVQAAYNKSIDTAVEMQNGTTFDKSRFFLDFTSTLKSKLSDVYYNGEKTPESLDIAINKIGQNALQTYFRSTLNLVFDRGSLRADITTPEHQKADNGLKYAKFHSGAANDKWFGDGAMIDVENVVLRAGRRKVSVPLVDVFNNNHRALLSVYKSNKAAKAEMMKLKAQAKQFFKDQYKSGYYYYGGVSAKSTGQLVPLHKEIYNIRNDEKTINSWFDALIDRASKSKRFNPNNLSKQELSDLVTMRGEDSFIHNYSDHEAKAAVVSNILYHMDENGIDTKGINKETVDKYFSNAETARWALSAKDHTKRSQLTVATGFRLPKGAVYDTPAIQNDMIRLVIVASDKGNITEIPIGENSSYTETASDGSTIMPLSFQSAVGKMIGIENRTALKPAGGQSGLYLKTAFHTAPSKATNDMLEKYGILTARDTAVKISGNKPIMPTDVYADMIAGKLSQEDLEKYITNVPVEDFVWNAGKKWYTQKVKGRHVLPKQIFTVPNPTLVNENARDFAIKAQEEVIRYMFDRNNLFDVSLTEKALRYISGETLSKADEKDIIDNFDRVPIGAIVRLLETSGDTDVKNKIISNLFDPQTSKLQDKIQELLNSNDDGDIERSEVAESKLIDLQQDYSDFQHLLSKIDDKEAIFLNPGMRRIALGILRNLAMKQYTSPKIYNSGEAVLSPTDAEMIKGTKLEALATNNDAFMLDSDFRDMEIRLRGNHITTLGKLWDSYDKLSFERKQEADEIFDFVLTRVPIGAPYGIITVRFAGFTDMEGGNIYLNPFRFVQLGGADTDFDTLKMFTGSRHVLKDGENTKYDGEGLTSAYKLAIRQYNNLAYVERDGKKYPLDTTEAKDPVTGIPYKDMFERKGDVAWRKTPISTFNPFARADVHLANADGRNTLGVIANNITYMNELATLIRENGGSFEYVSKNTGETLIYKLRSEEHIRRSSDMSGVALNMCADVAKFDGLIPAEDMVKLILDNAFIVSVKAVEDPLRNTEYDEVDESVAVKVKDYSRFDQVPKSGNGIVYVMRQHDVGFKHYGNPFSGSGKGNTIQIDGVEKSVNSYIGWLKDPNFEVVDKNGKLHKNIKPEQRKWILEQIDSGELDGKTLVYYKQPDVEGGKYYSHADALRDFINHRRSSPADAVKIVDDQLYFLEDVLPSGQRNGKQIYVGGFSDAGKGTPNGDGKDAAMRKVADSFIGEIDKWGEDGDNPTKDRRLSRSSTETSYWRICDKSEDADFYSTGYKGIVGLSDNPKVVMLARNGSLKDRPLEEGTKSSILKAHNSGASFVVGDMPGVDSQFVDYLHKIGADYTIYHAGNKPRYMRPDDAREPVVESPEKTVKAIAESSGVPEQKLSPVDIIKNETDVERLDRSIKVMDSERTILTNEELLVLRKAAGFKGNYLPKIATASERTDPVFFSKEVVKAANSGEYDALYIITKHDGLPMLDILQTKIPKLIHFSITTLGGSKWEPGVMKYNDMLDRIQDYIKQGLDPATITIRIDPLIPGVTKMEDVDAVVKRASAMGIKRIKTSVMDSYNPGHPLFTDMQKLGYTFDAYKDNEGRFTKHARQDVIDSFGDQMVAIAKKYGITKLYSCAENFKNSAIDGSIGCLDVEDVNSILGTSMKRGETPRNIYANKQRKDCSCYGGKVDVLSYANKCLSSCVYCYGRQGNNVTASYYKDGVLLDTPLTRTKKNVDNSDATKQDNHTVLRQKIISRSDLKGNQDKVYLFGDNLAHSGYGGQAKEMRGEPNAIGIPTKKLPSMSKEAFFSDSDFDVAKDAIDEAFAKIPAGKTVVIPADGLGTGLAKLEEKAPKIYEYLNEKIGSLENGTKTESNPDKLPILPDEGDEYSIIQDMRAIKNAFEGRDASGNVMGQLEFRRTMRHHGDIFNGRSNTYLSSLYTHGKDIMWEPRVVNSSNAASLARVYEIFSKEIRLPYAKGAKRSIESFVADTLRRSSASAMGSKIAYNYVTMRMYDEDALIDIIHSGNTDWVMMDDGIILNQLKKDGIIQSFKKVEDLTEKDKYAIAYQYTKQAEMYVLDNMWTMAEVMLINHTDVGTQGPKIARLAQSIKTMSRMSYSERKADESISAQAAKMSIDEAYVAARAALKNDAQRRLLDILLIGPLEYGHREGPKTKSDTTYQYDRDRLAMFEAYKTGGRPEEDKIDYKLHNNTETSPVMLELRSMDKEVVNDFNKIVTALLNVDKVGGNPEKIVQDMLRNPSRVAKVVMEAKKRSKLSEEVVKEDVKKVKLILNKTSIEGLKTTMRILNKIAVIEKQVPVELNSPKTDLSETKAVLEELERTNVSQAIKDSAREALQIPYEPVEAPKSDSEYTDKLKIENMLKNARTRGQIIDRLKDDIVAAEIADELDKYIPSDFKNVEYDKMKQNPEEFAAYEREYVPAVSKMKDNFLKRGLTDFESINSTIRYILGEGTGGYAGKDINAITLDDVNVINRYFDYLSSPNRLIDLVSKNPDSVIKKAYYYLFPDDIGGEQLKTNTVFVKTPGYWVNKHGALIAGQVLKPTSTIERVAEYNFQAESQTTIAFDNIRNMYEEELNPLRHIDNYDELYDIAIIMREYDTLKQSIEFAKLPDESKTEAITRIEDEYANAKKKLFDLSGKVYQIKVKDALGNDVIQSVNARHIVDKINHTLTKSIKDASKLIDANEDAIKSVAKTTADGSIMYFIIPGTNKLSDVPIIDPKKFHDYVEDYRAKHGVWPQDFGIDGLRKISQSMEISARWGTKFNDLSREEKGMIKSYLSYYTDEITTGKYDAESYFPHRWTDTSELKMHLDKWLARIDESNLPNQDKMDLKKNLMTAYLRRNGAIEDIDTGHENYVMMAEIADKIAMQEADKKQFIQFLKGISRSGNQTERILHAGGYARNDWAYREYLKTLVKAYYTNMSQRLSRIEIANMRKEMAKTHDINVANKWATFMHLYAQGAAGYSVILPDHVLNDPEMNVNKTLYKAYADNLMVERLNKMFVKLGLQTDVGNISTDMNVKDKEAPVNIVATLENLRKFSAAEGIFEMSALLMRLKAPIANLMGGSINTAISAGPRWLMNAQKVDMFSSIHKEWKTIDDVKKDFVKWGFIENYILSDLEISTNMKKKNYKAFVDAAIKKINEDPSVKDNTMLEIARAYGITDALAQKASWFMRVSERKLRLDSAMAHYLKAIDALSPLASFDEAASAIPYDSPILLEMARKGVKATQFIYSAPYRPMFSNSSIGKIMTRFQMYALNSVKFRNQILNEAAMYDFKPGTEQYKKFQRMAVADLMSFALANAFVYSIFDSNLPQPYEWLQNLADWMFGGKGEKERAFFGAYPTAIAPIQMVSPPALRLVGPTVSAILENDYKRLATYNLVTMAPGGMLAMDIRNALKNPEMAVEKLTGIPQQAIVNQLKKRRHHITGAYIENDK